MRFKTEPLRKTTGNSDSEHELESEIQGYIDPGITVKMEIDNDTDNGMAGDVGADGCSVGGTVDAGIDITPAQALLLASLASSADRGGAAFKVSKGWTPGWGAATPTLRTAATASAGTGTNRDLEARNAQDKLRKIAALGHIKVELDDSHDVSTGESPQEGGQNTAEFAAIMNTAAASGQTAFTPGQTQTLVMPGGEHVMLLPNQMAGPNQYFLAAPQMLQQQQPQPPQQQQQQHNTGSVDLPAHNDWPGEHGFLVKIEEKERTVKSPMWMMSSITKKLYTNINKPVPFEIFMQRRPPGVKFNIRATLIYSSQQFMRTNVNRCPNHAAPTDTSNHEFPYPEHVVRADHPCATYEKHPNGRLSVVVPLDNLQDGMEFTPILLRFMCLGSCVGGINRRPIAIILGLEDMSGRTVGRRVIHVRVCACPTRDIKSDEMQFQNKGIKRKGSSGHTELKSFTKKTKTKEPKLEPTDEDDDDDRIYYLPVRGRKMYNYLQEMMMLFSRHFPEHSKSSDVETTPDENLQQKPPRLMELKEFGSKNTIHHKPKILKSTNSVPKGNLEQDPNVILQNSAVHKNSSEKYPNVIIQNASIHEISSETGPDKVFQNVLNIREVDKGTMKTKPVVSSPNLKNTSQQKHIFFKKSISENVGTKYQLVTKDDKTLIQVQKVNEEVQIPSKNLDIMALTGHIQSREHQLVSTDKETILHMPEVCEEAPGTSKSFDVGVLTRHIPVVPITHFIPRNKLIKAKSSPVKRVNVISENIPTISRASSLSNIRISKGKNTSANNEGIPYTTSVDVLPSNSLRSTIVQSLSPDSPEMMAANVLINGLKHSLPKDIKKPPDESGE